MHTRTDMGEAGLCQLLSGRVPSQRWTKDADTIEMSFGSV